MRKTFLALAFGVFVFMATVEFELVKHVKILEAQGLQQSAINNDLRAELLIHEREMAHANALSDKRSHDDQRFHHELRNILLTRKMINQHGLPMAGGQ